MIKITYPELIIATSVIWLIVRVFHWIKNRRINIAREALLLLVYICIIVVERFTFFPFSKVNGVIQPLVFDASKALPPRMNFIPFIYLFDYPSVKEVLLNLIGNIAMLIPLGIVWPAVFRELDSHKKVIFAGGGISLCIEILQLPFYDRVSDIDDLILNSLGFIIGYGVYLLVKLPLKKKSQTLK